MNEEFESINISDQIPKIPCVYLLMNDIELIYVGNTCNLRFRLSQHKRKIREYEEIFDSVLFIPIEDTKKRSKLERMFISEFDPKWNYNYSAFALPVKNPWRC